VPVNLTIVTPDGEWYQGSVNGIVLPGAEGDFGVLPSHERFLTPIRIGEIEIHTPDGERLYAAVSTGFAEVTADEVAVMVESCEFAHEIDTARAQLDRERAEQGLANLGGADAERRAGFEAALERARNRIQVSERKK